MHGRAWVRTHTCLDTRVCPCLCDSEVVVVSLPLQNPHLCDERQERHIVFDFGVFWIMEICDFCYFMPLPVFCCKNKEP